MSSAALPDAGSRSLRAEFELSIGGMTCAACAARVERRLGSIGGVAASVNLATGRAAVTVPPSVPAARLVEAVQQAGYDAQILPAPGARDASEDSAGSSEAARVAYLRRRLIVALVFFVPLGDVSVLLSLFPAFRFPGWQWFLVALAVPVAGWAAWPFHRAALKNARHGSTSMDTLVSLGITAACAWSGYAMFVLDRGQPQGQRAAPAPACLRRGHLPRSRGVGDHLPAGRAVV